MIPSGGLGSLMEHVFIFSSFSVPHTATPPFDTAQDDSDHGFSTYSCFSLFLTGIPPGHLEDLALGLGNLLAFDDHAEHVAVAA